MATQTATELELELLPATSKSQRSDNGPLSIGRTLGSEEVIDIPIDTAGPLSPPKLSQSRAWIVMAQLVSVNFIINFCGGLVTIGLPVFALDLNLSDDLLIWPISVTSLAGGACVLLAGTIADVLGPKKVYLTGAFLAAIFILVCGSARDGIELIMFRALQGIAGALVGPSASSIISTNIERGRTRNIGFASLYLAFPLGYGLGMVVGGVLVSTVGWRSGFYGAGVLQYLIASIAVWTLPKDKKLGSFKQMSKRLSTEIDWMGALIACTCVSTFSYVLAQVVHLYQTRGQRWLTFSQIVGRQSLQHQAGYKHCSADSQLSPDSHLRVLDAFPRKAPQTSSHPQFDLEEHLIYNRPGHGSHLQRRHQVSGAVL